MSAIQLHPAALTKAGFAPFGDVLEVAGADTRIINEGTTKRFHALATLDVADQNGVPGLSVFRATARPAPIKIAMMERHPIGSQAFFPLSDFPWLVVVCAAAIPSPATLQAFLASGNQGIQYAKNVWHHPLLIVEKEQDFLVADRLGNGDNLEEVWFEEGVYSELIIPSGL